MSLRRTALQRRSELRRTPLVRKKPMARARAVRIQVAKARRDTGPTREQRAIVLDRARGCCEMCGGRLHVAGRGWVARHAIHHRQPRQMGGTSRPEINSPANLLLICDDGTERTCHRWVESHRAEAYELGLLVRASADPASVPVLLEGGDRYLLTADGGRVLLPSDEGVDVE
ncbi:HNH endonuclease [Pimelobacter simplex]|uniref:HNH endonuclease n=1 Tax=Nocardioides simplex TaxID=2045 RepID=A0A7J5DQW2_NOCSI|nr:HNH endonuclease [Pimelobacter simplex]KAB2806970.1 HNH endonuclease [Pimelobacter simplex]